jgi:cyclopropane-fatty-acyl-phospholipid synthase
VNELPEPTVGLGRSNRRAEVLPRSPTTLFRVRRAGPVDRRLLAHLQRHLGDAPVALRLGADLESPPRPGDAIATITMRDRRTLLALLRRPELAFGDAYMSGRLDVEGDLVGALEALYRAHADGSDGPRALQAARTWTARLRARLLRQHGRRAARHNIHHHYDLGNDFYRLWLDREMVYTCAYFPSPGASLEKAQLAKMAYVCRKLGLRPNDQVVEAGSGWGALALYMARHYGARVRAFNISREQVRFARERARAEQLSDRVEFVEDDYRNITGSFDVFVSVGMLEHVGLECYETLGRLIRRVVRLDGRGLLHFIGRNQPQPLNAWIAKRIFPGGYPPTLAEVTRRVLEPANLSVLDVENLRLHYAETLRHWRTRFEAASEQVTRMFDLPFARAWRLYLAGSEAAFRAGSLKLFQVVFAPARATAWPSRGRRSTASRSREAPVTACDVLVVGGGRRDRPAPGSCAPGAPTCWSSTGRASRGTRSAPAGSRRPWSTSSRSTSTTTVAAACSSRSRASAPGSWGDRSWRPPTTGR